MYAIGVARPITVDLDVGLGAVSDVLTAEGAGESPDVPQGGRSAPLTGPYVEMCQHRSGATAQADHTRLGETRRGAGLLHQRGWAAVTIGSRLACDPHAALPGARKDYGDVWAECSSAGEQDEWEVAVGDGLGDAAR